MNYRRRAVYKRDVETDRNRVRKKLIKREVEKERS